jgi:hypothetical protein
LQILCDQPSFCFSRRHLGRKSPHFANKVISVPNDDAWYPSLDQLFAAGVVTAATPDTNTHASS